MSSRRVWEVEGRHVVVVAAREELSAPSRVALPPPEPAPGLILPDGSVNWGCPCLGGMATGPCGAQFRDAFSCFHYSEADPKGSDCYEKFSVMQECMAQYPTLYGRDDDDDDELAAALQDAAPQDGARDGTAPRAEDAGDRTAPRADGARDSTAPLAEDAGDRTTPLAEDAGDRTAPRATAAPKE